MQLAPSPFVRDIAEAMGGFMRESDPLILGPGIFVRQWTRDVVRTPLAMAEAVACEMYAE